MADAVRVPGVPPKVVTPPDTIQLTLSIEEAVVLKAVFGMIGGIGNITPSMAPYGYKETTRKITDEIGEALRKVGIDYPFNGTDEKTRLFSGSLQGQDIVRLQGAVESATKQYRQKQEDLQRRVPASAYPYGSVGAGILGIRFP